MNSIGLDLLQRMHYLVNRRMRKGIWTDTVKQENKNPIKMLQQIHFHFQMTFVHSTFN